MELSETKKRIDRITSVLEFFNRKYSPDAMELFIEATAEIPWEKFAEGCRKVIATSRFMPTPAEFRELAITDLPSPKEQIAAWQKKWEGKRV